MNHSGKSFQTRGSLLVLFSVCFLFYIDRVEAFFSLEELKDTARKHMPFGTLPEDIITLGNSRIQRERRRQEAARQREQKEARERERKERIKSEIRRLEITKEAFRERKIFLEGQVKERTFDIESLEDVQARYKRMEEKVVDFLDRQNFINPHTYSGVNDFINGQGLGGPTKKLSDYIVRLERLLEKIDSRLEADEIEALSLLQEQLKAAKEERVMEEEFYLTILESSEGDFEERFSFNITKIVTTLSALESETKTLSRAIEEKKEENKAAKRAIEKIENDIKKLTQNIHDQYRQR